LKLKVENLARIKNAEVEIKNLTLFVGQNSTHKSYLAHVVYELFKEIGNLGHNHVSKLKFSSIISRKIHQNFREDIEYILSLKRELYEHEVPNQVAEDEYELEIYTRMKIHLGSDNSRLKVLLEKIHKVILEELAKKINTSFNTNKQIIDALSLENTYDILNQAYLELFFGMPLEYFEENKDEISNKILNTLTDNMITNLQTSLEGYNESYYFPASRTGFVLTLDEIYAGIFRDKFRGQVSATRLGEPTIDFVQTFADMKSGLFEKHNFLFFKPNNNNQLISFLEKNIIKGKIKEITNDQDYTSYYLNVDGEELDLHLSSSATLETLPFIVFLKNMQDISKTFFVIEEPEAHLHPKAQIQMAKFLVMLTNAGAKVLVTTHSDYILNEINNCIKLDSIDNMDELSISKDKVSSYLLKNEDTITTVNSLEIDKFGIANDNFDEVLDELLERSSELSEKIVDGE